MASVLKVDKLDPQSGTALEIGTSGDTITVPSGATLDISASTLTPPATMPASSGINLTALNATNLGSGTVAIARGGTGTSSYSPALSWQSVQTSTPFTAVAGNGYPVNTTSGAITMNLPAGVVGEQVGVVDYAGTFDTNALTIAANGSENIKGTNTDVEMITERQAGVLTYVDATQGWVVTSAAPDPGVAPNPYVVATGGTITTDGDYKVHTFNDDGDFIVTNAGGASGSNTVDYLVVAGGGGGGNYKGGAGAGGYRFSYPNPATGGLPVSATPYPISVGGGGGGAAPGPYVRGVSGSSAIFSTITSAGGGGGGTYAPGPGAGANVGLDGGSGGGGGVLENPKTPGTVPGTGGSGNTPPAPVSQGNPGGIGTRRTGTPTNSYGGGGGGGGIGGSGTAGTPGDDAAGGPGGGGSAISITGGSVTYAGGGGGGSGPGSTPGSGGSGGGGAAAVYGAPAVDGTANLGGGGGAGGASQGGSGGKGVVIIRYKFQ